MIGSEDYFYTSKLSANVDSMSKLDFLIANLLFSLVTVRCANIGRKSTYFVYFCCCGVIDSSVFINETAKMFRPSNSILPHYFSMLVKIQFCVDVNSQIFDDLARNRFCTAHGAGGEFTDILW
jgi:hypothetical protein